MNGERILIAYGEGVVTPLELMEEMIWPSPNKVLLSQFMHYASEGRIAPKQVERLRRVLNKRASDFLGIALTLDEMLPRNSIN